jgi:predicted dehydrogenase
MSEQQEMRIGLVGLGTGGASSYHARSFSMILNGQPEGGREPDWPAHEIRVPGGRVTAVWDEDVEVARAHAARFGIEHACERLEDLIGLVDGVMVLDDLSVVHQRRAFPFLEAGVPTFVDKPLTTDLEEAGRLLATARAHGTTFMSTSALRYAKELTDQQAEIAAAGDPVVTIAACQGSYLGELNVIHYGIHPLELAYAVLGPGIESAQNVGDGDSHVVKLRHRTKGTVLLVVEPGIQQAFRLSIMGSDGDVHVVGADWDAFYAGMLATFLDAVRTRTSPVPFEETYELIGALIAARESKLRGGAAVAVSATIPALDEVAR